MNITEQIEERIEKTWIEFLGINESDTRTRYRRLNDFKIYKAGYMAALEKELRLNIQEITQR